MSEFDKSILTIDSVEYQIELLNTSEAFLTGQEVVKLALPSMGAAADGLMSQDILEEPSTFTAVAFHLIRQLGDVDTLSIIKKLLTGLKANGEDVDFESYFRGRFDLLAKLVEFALKENFGSLFTGLGLRERLMTYIQDLTSQIPEQPKSEESESSSEKTVESQTLTDSSST